MKLFRFDAEVGRPVTAFGSDHTVLTRILKTTAGVQIGCMHLQRGGVIGLHQAVGPQLFLVVQGEGWVRGKEATRTLVRAGHAVFWESGEWHETRTESGMTAIVIEGEELNPGEYMSLVE